jgi:hypothetical protein
VLSGVNRAVLWDTHGNYALSRLVFQRGIGLVYLIAFVCALNQFCPVLGEHGLLPVPTFVRQVPFRATPSLFFFAPKDWAFKAAAWCGIVLSCPIIAGIADAWSSWMNALIWFAIRVLYLSFVNVGQISYGFGWESISWRRVSSQGSWVDAASRRRCPSSGCCAGSNSASCLGLA